jgi:hypothetical protein
MKFNLQKSLSGEYIFYKNGIEVARSKNIVTTLGKEAILKYLSRESYEYASRLVLGCGSTAASVSDEFLSLEMFATSINFKTLDYTKTPTQLVFRSTLPSTFNGVIYESGITTGGGSILSDLNSVNDYQELVATFDPDFENWSISSGVAFHTNDLEGTPRLRVGKYGLQITAPSSSTIQSTLDSVVPVFPYISSDKIKVALHISGSVPSSVIVKISNDGLNYYSLTIPSNNLSLGYNIVNYNVGQLIATGSPEISQTQSISVIVNSSASESVVTMDAIKFDSISDLEKPILVSRSVLSTPLVVEGGYPFDIEYRLAFDI